MDSIRKPVKLKERQADIQQCESEQKTRFTSQTHLLQGCSADEDECLCAQNGDKSFSDSYLDAICNTCDGSQDGTSIDPSAALEDICPGKSSALASSYTCVHYTPSPSAPVGASDPTASTTVFISQVMPGSSYSRSTNPTGTTTPAILMDPSQTHLSVPFATFISKTSTETIQPSTTTTLSESPTTVAALDAVSVRRQGLSAGAKAGIGVAVSISCILLILALLFFIFRRRKRIARWNANEMNSREIYSDSGMNSAYALNRNDTEVPIGTAITTEDKTHLRSDESMPAVREIYLDNEGGESPRERELAMIGTKAPMNSPDSPETMASFHDLPSPPPKPKPVTVITRKEVPTSYPPLSKPTTLPHAIYSTSPPQSRSDSQISGGLRGPVPDLYAFGGETVDNDEELERLEDEERRIDEAIQESERLKRGT